MAMEREAGTAGVEYELAIGCVWKRCSDYHVRNQEYEVGSASLKEVARPLYSVNNMMYMICYLYLWLGINRLNHILTYHIQGDNIVLYMESISTRRRISEEDHQRAPRIALESP
jgi:hypothetical protein